MTEKGYPPRKLSKAALDYFGFKALVGAMGAATLLPYFIPISFPAIVAWLFLYKPSLARYGKSGVTLYYFAPTLASIGAGLGFVSDEWRLAMATTYFVLILPLVLYVTRPAKLWTIETDAHD